MMKHWKSWTAVIATVVAIIASADDLLSFGEGVWDKYILGSHTNQVHLFAESSSIIDHRFDEDGVLYLKYRTCNPPSETPEYYYSVWIDGNPVFHSQSVAPHFSINTWFKPIFCTEGWWGNKGFEGAKVGDEVVVNWHWLLDDGSYEETIMKYLIK